MNVVHKKDKNGRDIFYRIEKGRDGPKKVRISSEVAKREISKKKSSPRRKSASRSNTSHNDRKKSSINFFNFSPQQDVGGNAIEVKPPQSNLLTMEQLNNMTIVELTNIARQINLKGYSDLNKDDLVTAVYKCQHFGECNMIKVVAGNEPNSMYNAETRKLEITAEADIKLIEVGIDIDDLNDATEGSTFQSVLKFARTLWGLKNLSSEQMKWIRILMSAALVAGGLAAATHYGSPYVQSGMDGIIQLFAAGPHRDNLNTKLFTDVQNEIASTNNILRDREDQSTRMAVERARAIGVNTEQSYPLRKNYQSYPRPDYVEMVEYINQKNVGEGNVIYTGPGPTGQNIEQRAEFFGPRIGPREPIYYGGAKGGGFTDKIN